MCISAEISKRKRLRAQEDFLVAYRTINLEYKTLGLRTLIDLKDTSTAVLLVEDYVGKFTTYLKRVQPLLTGLSLIVAKLNTAKP
jgi:hypothetical protein